uniref:Uncharacterized protein n=1 Tax=Ciona intestinalis TaxID=7719 RepID=H2XU35_CIOIN
MRFVPRVRFAMFFMGPHARFASTQGTLLVYSNYICAMSAKQEDQRIG